MQKRDKVLLITGSTTGIGEAIARRCIKEGAKVMLHGLEADLAIKLQHEFGSNVSYIIADLADPENHEKIIQATLNHFGKLDCLVNNAAATTRSNILNLTPAIFDYVFAVNVKAPTFLSQAAIKQFMLQKSAGIILNIGSINAYCGEQVLVPYAASKAALMNLTRTLADSLAGTGIRVNQLNLGWVATANEIKLKISEGFASDWYQHIPNNLAPSGKILTPEDVAEIALPLLSELTSIVSGSVIDCEQFPMTCRLNGNQNGFFNLQTKNTQVPATAEKIKCKL